MKRRFVFLFILLALFMPLGARQTSEQKAALRADITKKLAGIKNPADSLPLLYDLYDLSSVADQKKLGWTVLHTAQRAGDAEAIMDMCRQLATYNVKSDSVLRILESINSKLPSSEVQQATDVFIAVKRATHNARYLPEADRQKELTRILAKRTGTKDNVFDDVKELYTLTLYLGSNTKGGMYKDYVSRLDDEIQKLPERALTIRNLFYTSLAMFYTQNLEHEKAIAADKKFLESVKKLEERYENKGRKYRNFDMPRYSAYRRILGNYEALPLSTVDSFYNQAIELTHLNNDVRTENESNPRLEINYLMAHKKYAEAIPLIKKFLNSDSDSNINTYRLMMLHQLKVASTAIGDNATLLECLKEYNDELEEYFRQNSDGLYRELQVRYDVNELRQKNHKLDIQKKDLEVKTEQIIILVAVIAACILLFIIIMLHRRHTTMRIQLQNLQEELDRKNASEKTLRDL